jgi:hypothetical protein
MDPTPFSTAFSTLVHLEDNLNWSGGAVPSGGAVLFTLALDVPDLYTTFTLRAVPTVIPEPSMLALVGAGLFGLLAYGWWRRKGGRPVNGPEADTIRV